MAAKKKTVRKTETEKKPDYYVAIDKPVAIYNNLVANSKVHLKLLEQFAKIQETKKEKESKIREFEKLSREIKSDLLAIQKELPKQNLVAPKIAAPKKNVTSKPAEIAPKKTSEFSPMESEISQIEARIKNL